MNDRNIAELTPPNRTPLNRTMLASRRSVLVAAAAATTALPVWLLPTSTVAGAEQPRNTGMQTMQQGEVNELVHSGGVLIVAQWEARAAEAEKVADILQRFLPRAQAEPGVKLFLIARNKANPAQFMFYELFHRPGGVCGSPGERPLQDVHRRRSVAAPRKTRTIGVRSALIGSSSWERASVMWRVARATLKAIGIAALSGVAITVNSVPGFAQSDAKPPPAPASTQGQATKGAEQTLKERLSDKASDEQRVDDCKVPADRRGAKPRPDKCE
jgi:hypothetical protein